MTITIEIDDERKSELEALAAHTGQTLDEIVRDAVERKLRGYRFDRIRRRLAGYAEAAGFRSEREILDAIS